LRHCGGGRWRDFGVALRAPAQRRCTHPIGWRLRLRHGGCRGLLSGVPGGEPRQLLGRQVLRARVDRLGWRAIKSVPAFGRRKMRRRPFSLPRATATAVLLLMVPRPSMPRWRGRSTAGPFHYLPSRVNSSWRARTELVEIGGRASADFRRFFDAEVVYAIAKGPSKRSAVNSQ
jgi:hypothetical protein